MSADREDLSKLLSSASLVFLGTLVSSGSGLLERAIIGRMLSPDGYGEFSIALAVFTLGATLGAAGFTQGIPRFMARFDNIRDTRGAWLTGLVISTGFSAAIVLVLLFGAPYIVPRLFESEEAFLVFAIFALAIPVYVCFKMGIGAIRGEENTRYKVLTQNLAYPLFRIALITGLLVTGAGLIATGLGYLIALLAVAALTYVFLNRLMPLQGEFTFHTREMTIFSAPLVISTVMNVLLTRTDTLMLGYFRASSEVGIYNAAYPLAGAMAIVLGAFGYLYLPMASRLDSEEGGSVGRVYQVTTKWLYLIAFPGFVTLIAFPEEILSIVFGSNYVAGGTALVILAIGTFTNAAVGRNRETLSALGATNFILLSNVVAFGFNFVANLLLIPRYGFMGAAVASASSYFLLNLIVFGVLRLKYDITPFYRKSLRAYVILPLIIVPIGLFVGNALHGNIPIIVLFGISVGVLTITVAALAGALEPDDIVLIEFAEDATNLRIPLLRRFIPDSGK